LGAERTLVPSVEDQFEIIGRLLLAGLLGGFIGLERELRGNPAGIRTIALVTLGACLFTDVSQMMGGDDRVAAQVVTGIGFIGAGVVFREGAGVKGITTAATIWAAAAIGMAVGAGFWGAALIGTGVVLVGLGPLRWAEGWVVARRRPGGGTLEVDLRPEQPLAPVLAVLEGGRARVRRIHLEEEEEGRELRVEVELPVGASGRELVEQLAGLDEVLGVRWDE